MAFVGILFVICVLIGAPLCGLFYLALCLIFRHLHKKYLLRAEVPQKKWRRILAIITGILAGINLLVGIAGWAFYLIAILSIS